jgi:hypothetical protein
MKTIKLNGKTNLRNRILDNYFGQRTTDEYTWIVIDSDGDIDYYNQSCVCSDELSFKIRNFYHLFSGNENRAEASKILTQSFRVFENMLNGDIPECGDMDVVQSYIN